jgi:class 3 adenylate cyclase
MNADPGRINPLTLHFADVALERAFREERARKMLKPIRVTVLIVAVLAISFWLLLPRFLPEYRDARGQFVWPTVAIVAGMLWLYARSYLPSFLRRQQLIMAAGCVLMTVGAVGLTSLLPMTALGTFGLSVLLMHTLNIYNIFRLRFPMACLAGWSSAMVHLGYFNHTGALAWPELGHQAGGLLAANIFGMIACYQFDHASRREFLAMRLLGQERERSERLLLNVLPAAIADRLKASSESIADHSAEVTVLFADIVGFTPLSAKKSPQELVRLLDLIFSEFDALAEKHGLEKIKTIGDAYMAAAGLPNPRANHAAAAAHMAADMLAAVARIAAETGEALRLRVGLNSGPVVAGVIGRKKFIYDLWGDTVNTASRMESHGVPGMIQVSEATATLLRPAFSLTARDAIQVDGKGEMQTFLLGASPGSTDHGT